MKPESSPPAPVTRILLWIGGAVLIGALGVFIFRDASSRTRLNRLATSEPPAKIGREVYISEGCIHCHTQYVRPGTDDELLWGPAADPARVAREQPPLIGNRRQGPDLMNVGNRRSPQWNTVHLMDPRSLIPASRMPSYAHLFSPGDRRGEMLVAYLQTLGADTLAQREAQIQAWKPASDATPIAPTAAATLFQEYCVRCYGKDDTGSTVLANVFGGKAKSQPEPSVESVARAIKFGVPAASMPGDETLTDGEILGLVHYMQSLPRNKETP